MTAIRGNTFPVKELLRSLGGRWNGLERCWHVPDNRADVAQRIVRLGATQEALDLVNETVTSVSVGTAPAADPEPTPLQGTNRPATFGFHRFAWIAVCRSGRVRPVPGAAWRFSLES